MFQSLLFLFCSMSYVYFRYIINVGDIMDKRLFCISTRSTYLQLKNLLRRSNLLSYAFVDKPGESIQCFILQN